MNKMAVVKRVKDSDNCFQIGFSKLTKGELLSLKNALESYSTACIEQLNCMSPASDVLCYLNNAIQEANDPRLADV